MFPHWCTCIWLLYFYKGQRYANKHFCVIGTMLKSIIYIIDMILMSASYDKKHIRNSFWEWNIHVSSVYNSDLKEIMLNYARKNVSDENSFD